MVAELRRVILVRSVGEPPMPVSKGKVGEEPEGSSALEEAEEGGFGRLGEAAVVRRLWFGHPLGRLKHLAF